MRKYDDSYRHKGMRKKLTDLVRSKGITNEKVLAAIENIPRHYFLDSAFEEVAYEDRAFPIAEGQTISQPYTVAYQTQLLEVQPFQKVLEIGTGSASQASVTNLYRSGGSTTCDIRARAACLLFAAANAI